jgi:hypothetical protein
VQSIDDHFVLLLCDRFSGFLMDCDDGVANEGAKLLK